MLFDVLHRMRAKWLSIITPPMEQDGVQLMISQNAKGPPVVDQGTHLVQHGSIFSTASGDIAPVDDVTQKGDAVIGMCKAGIQPVKVGMDVGYYGQRLQGHTPG